MLSARPLGPFTAPRGDSVFDADNICPSPTVSTAVQRGNAMTFLAGHTRAMSSGHEAVKEEEEAEE